MKTANDTLLTRRNFVRTCVGVSVGGAAMAALYSAGIRQRPPESPPAETPLDTDASNSPAFRAAYLALAENGELRKRGEALWERMRACDLCPRNCGVDRLAGQPGFCRANADLIIASHAPHYGEEAPLVGRGGSGTIFFSHCGLRCIFCINYNISHGGQGRKRTLDDLADMMLSLQNRGCHNINVVTPTHYSPHILLAIDLAAQKGLRLPIVYNTCAWEKLDVLEQLDGVVDIYLPDFKYADEEMAEKHLAGAHQFPDIVRQAILEMHRQVGVARPNAEGIMQRGVMIRHLVMPNDVANTREIMQWIARHLSKDTYVNIMSQYSPVHHARTFPEVSRRINRGEYQQAIDWAREAGLTRIDSQRMPWR